MHRIAVAVAAAVGVLLVPAGPAHADNDLSVIVARVTPDQVRLDAEIPGVSGGGLPPVTVTRDGWLLPSTIEAAPPGPTADRTVVIVLDTGDHMAGPSLRAARAGVLEFAEAVPAEVAIGLVAAADEPTVALRPTRDRAALRTAMSELSVGGNTDIFAGLRIAAGLAKGATDGRLLVVAGSPDSAGDAPAIDDLRAAGQRIDLAAVGDATTGSDQLREVVAATGGTVRSAPSADGLSGMLRAAAATIPLRVTITVAVPPDLAGAAGTLTVTAGKGVSRARADVDVRFASPQAVSSPAGGTRRLLPSLVTSETWLLAGLVFGTLLVSMLLALSGVGGSVRRRRLKQVEQFRLAGRASRGGAAFPVPTGGGFAQTVLGLSDRIVTARGVEERVARKLDRAGMELRPHEWTAWRIGAGVAGAVLFGLADGLLGALLGVAMGWLAAGLYRRVRGARRRQSFADQLPDALQLIVGSLKSGFSLAQAIDAVVQDSPPGPLTVELGRAMAEVRLGSDLDDALERTAQRVDNDDLAWTVMAIRIQRDTGGNLAEVLETTVETLRERDRLRRHVRALSAEGRLSAYVLVGLPLVMAAWMFLARRDYLSALWTTPTGLVMLAGAAVLMLVGTVWMARWVKVEV